MNDQQPIAGQIHENGAQPPMPQQGASQPPSGLPPMREERRELTKGQIQEINRLNNQVAEKRQQLIDFLNYLAAEHDCDGEGWQVDGTALVRQVPIE